MILPIQAPSTRPARISRREWQDNARSLFRAAAAGDAVETDRLATIGDPFHVDYWTGCTALHVAAMRGHLDCVKALEPVYEAMNVYGYASETPLHCAARAGHADCVAHLLPLTDPAWHPSIDSPLMSAAVGGNVECVRLLMPAADPAISGIAEENPLHVAARHGHVQCVELLVALLDPNALDGEGFTALHRAALRGSVGCVKALLPQCDPLRSNRDGRSSIDLARSAGHDDAADLMLLHVAGVEASAIADAAALQRPATSTRASRASARSL